MRDKLLVLDDELLILKSLESLFEDDYEVFTTNDAEAALQLAGEHDFAVILCDERMPGMPGHEFLRRVRAVSNAVRVMMSGFADIHVSHCQALSPLARVRMEEELCGIGVVEAF